MSNNALWGKLTWGAGEWAANSAPAVTLTATFTGSTTFTANLVVTFSVLFKGAASLMQAVTALFLSQGVFNQPITCIVDSVLRQYLNPRTSPVVLMPIAYVVEVNTYRTGPTCSPNTTTIPVTGSNATIVEGSAVPQNMP